MIATYFSVTCYYHFVYFLTDAVLRTKSDSDVIFVYKVIRELQSTDHSCAEKIRIQVIYRFALAHENFLLNNYKQNIMSLSLLVGTTVQ